MKMHPPQRAQPLVNSTTRTVAIITGTDKPHALDHRFKIEHRITEARFEVRLLSQLLRPWLYSYDPQIVKERQMELDVESDPDTLFELLGDDARSFVE
jgi:hypothetical protein